MSELLIAFERLVHVMTELREKCPWDIKQTNESLRYLTLELFLLDIIFISLNSKLVKITYL